jgi:hypothetical protein
VALISDSKAETGEDAVGERVVIGLFKASDWIKSDMSFRCTVGEAEYQCGIMIPRVSNPVRIVRCGETDTQTTHRAK